MVLFSKHKLAVALLITVTTVSVLACKKHEDHTSFYFESVSLANITPDENKVQQSNQLEVYKFTNNPPGYDIMGINGDPHELLWLRASRTYDFSPMSSAQPVTDNNRTQARFMYDAENLYISIRCWDVSTVPTALTPGQDLRLGNSDIVCLYLEPNGDNTDIFSIQIAPNGVVTFYVFATASGNTFSIPAGGTNNIMAAAVKPYYDGREGSFNGWCAEIKIPFNAAYYGMESPASGPTTWKANIIRHNYDQDGSGVVPRGRYAWKDPASPQDHNPGVYYGIHYNTTNISDAPFQVALRGLILSGGPVHIPDHGFIGRIASYDFGSPTPLNISLGQKINPGEVRYTQSVRVGDSLAYRFYVKRPDGSVAKSFYEQKHLIR